MDAARHRIVQAINAGAPLYNQGKIRECRDLYMIAAKMMLSEAHDQLPPSVATALSTACTESWNNANPDTGAWAMRRCFDSILNGSISISDATDEVAPLWASQGEISLLDYSSSPESLLVPSWRPMDDQVMGGRSESAFTWSPGSAIFAGTVTTANNGGFASCRSEGWDEYGSKLKGAKGIRLVVRGDGRTYKISAKTEDTWDGVMYQQDFGTKAALGDEEWETVDLPFSRFKPTFRGQLVNGRPPLTGSKIRQLGFMYSKFSDSGGITPGFTTGNFRLAIRGIRGFV
jgi:hypothetical protein